MTGAGIATCPACGVRIGNRQRFLAGRPDREYGVALQLNYWRCASTRCRHVFAAPLPGPEQIAALYARYSTHTQLLNSGSRKLLLRFLDTGGVGQITQVPGFESLRCLDYGCGNGALLDALRRCGMTRLAGFDFDPLARQAARTLGLAVFDEERDAVARGPYDLIIMNHVIEHLAAPSDTLDRLSRCLAPGGRLLLRTPNADSWLAHRFKADWRGWETPRHLHVFTAGSLVQMLGRALAPACRITGLDTSNAMFPGIFHTSFHGRFWHGTRGGKLLRHGLSLLAWPYALLRRFVMPLSGEELRCTIKRGPDAPPYA